MPILITDIKDKEVVSTLRIAKENGSQTARQIGGLYYGYDLKAKRAYYMGQLVAFNQDELAALEEIGDTVEWENLPPDIKRVMLDAQNENSYIQNGAQGYIINGHTCLYHGQLVVNIGGKSRSTPKTSVGANDLHEALQKLNWLQRFMRWLSNI